MYHVSAQGVDERMINVHYYYYYYCVRGWVGVCARAKRSVSIRTQTNKQGACNKPLVCIQP